MNPSQKTLNHARNDLRHLISDSDISAIDSLCYEDALKRHECKGYLYFQDAYTLMLSMYADELRYQVERK